MKLIKSYIKAFYFACVQSFVSHFIFGLKPLIMIVCIFFFSVHTWIFNHHISPYDTNIISTNLNQLKSTAHYFLSIFKFDFLKLKKNTNFIFLCHNCKIGLRMWVQFGDTIFRITKISMQFWQVACEKRKNQFEKNMCTRRALSDASELNTWIFINN